MNEPTKKRIWALSNNKCYICKAEITDEVNNKSIIYGEMAHIVSKKPKGPRHRPMTDYDHISNFLILCPNDHKLIDQQPEHYPEKALTEIKVDHERSNKINKIKNTNWVGKITSEATELASIINGAHLMYYDVDAELGLNETAYKFKDELHKTFEYWDILENIPFEELKRMQAEINDVYINNLVILSTLEEIDYKGIPMMTGHIYITSKNHLINLKKKNS